MQCLKNQIFQFLREYQWNHSPSIKMKVNYYLVWTNTIDYFKDNKYDTWGWKSQRGKLRDDAPIFKLMVQQNADFRGAWASGQAATYKVFYCRCQLCQTLASTWYRQSPFSKFVSKNLIDSKKINQPSSVSISSRGCPTSAVSSTS